MHFHEYSERMEKFTHKDGQMIPPSIAALGLAGEAGEVADLVKKFLWHGLEMDRQEMVKELGDVLWYLNALAELYGSSLGEVASENIIKLEKRYPNGFVEGGGIR